MVVHILVSDLKLKKRPRLVREGKGGKKGLGINILFFFLYQKPHTLGSGKPCLKKIRLLQGKAKADPPGGSSIVRWRWIHQVPLRAPLLLFFFCKGKRKRINK